MVNNTTTACPSPMKATSNGVFQRDSPVRFELPLLIIQICLVLVVTRSLAVILKPIRQPRVISEIIGGILLGPSVMGRSECFANNIFPKNSLVVLETVADIGLIFYLFLVGLELDLRAIRRTGKQALAIAAAGISVPFVAGVGVSVILHKTIVKDPQFGPFLVFMGVALSITAFPVLARILAERRLLTTDVGQMAMSAAAVNDVVAWILLALAVALAEQNKSPTIAIWVLLCGLGFVIFMFVVMKPIMAIVAKHAIENEPVNEVYVAVTLAVVLIAGFCTDAIGIHSIFGAFVVGLIIPKDGPFAGILIEKIEDLVTILMLPLYFAASGLKTNIGSIHGAQSLGLLVLVITTACAGKIFGTVAVAYLNRMGTRKSFTLGFLMNTKGLVELIVLNIGRDKNVLNEKAFAIMVLMALFTTFITTPVVMALYKPARNPVPYMRRSVYTTDGKVAESELRVLACVHGMPNVHAIINLVEAVRGTRRRRPLQMFILHLLEYSERPSSIMKLQRVRRDGLPFWDKGQHEADNVVVAFEAYGQLSKVTVRPMIAISRFDDMHEDVCATASDRRAAIIILPFHKHWRPFGAGGGVWEGHSAGLRHVTLKVLHHAPCSIGILVDRGIGVASLSSSAVDHTIAVLFFGGPDDREALALGYRMAEHPGVRLTVYRFLQGDAVDHLAVSVPSSAGNSFAVSGAAHDGVAAHARFSINSRFSLGHDTFDYMMAADMDWAKEGKVDEDCLAAARKQQGVVAEEGAGAAGQIRYVEKAVGDAIVAAVEVTKAESPGLVVVGRGRRPAAMLAGYAGKHAEYPELGPVGEVLATTAELQCSVLVVQQHDTELMQETEQPAASSVKVVDVSTPGRLPLSPSVVVATSALSPGQGAAASPLSSNASPLPLINRKT